MGERYSPLPTTVFKLNGNYSYQKENEMKFPTANEIIELAEIIKWSMAGVKVRYLDNDGVEREAIVRSITRYHEDVREEMIRFTSTISGTEIFYKVADVLQWKLDHQIVVVK